jgi:hypothetical protein
MDQLTPDQIGAAGSLGFMVLVGGLIVWATVWYHRSPRARASVRRADEGCSRVAGNGCSCLLAVFLIAGALYLVVRFVHWAWFNGLPSAN